MQAETNIYLVRHCEPDYTVKQNDIRPLTPKGQRDTAKVTAYLADKAITQVFSSPYKRAVDTVQPFAQSASLPVHPDARFAERTISTGWVQDYNAFAQRQWQDFTYKEAGGESLGEVQARMVEGVRQLLQCYPGQAIAIGTHGTALCALLAGYIPGFGFAQFTQRVRLMPWVVQLTFAGTALTGCHETSL